MPVLRVEIARFVDEHQPGFVECTFVDAEGVRHSILEKLPVVTRENLWSTSIYPRPGEVACQVLAEWKDRNGQLVLRVSTEEPFHIESTDGQTQFVVLASQVLQ
jgi:hypothetical protein